MSLIPVQPANPFIFSRLRPEQPGDERRLLLVLDDLLWEKGREEPDLIGNEAGDLGEPPRREGVVFY